MATWIFTHGDTDGICAGAIALAANPNAQIFFTNPYGLIEDLTIANNEDKVIICDIALSENHLKQIIQRFSRIAEKGELIYIDHHPWPEAILKEDMPSKIIHGSASSSELTYSLFKSNIDPKLSRVAIFGAIGDYLDNTPFIKHLLERWDKRALYFESGLLTQGIEGRKRDYELKRSILFKLANNFLPSSDKRLVELALEQSHLEELAIQKIKDYIHFNGKIAYTLNFPFSLGKAAIYAKGLTDALIGIAAEERKGMIDMSLRTSNPKIDLNKILRLITPKFGGSGGGHSKAAGARLPKEKFEDFLNELNKSLKELDYNQISKS
ncbi:MAG: DHHA1 domain-containing protein [Nitrososphaerales archaeon]